MKNLVNFIKEGFDAPQDNVITYDGKKKCFAIANTSASEFYDDSVAVMLCEEKNLEDNWADIDMKKVGTMKVGDTISLEENNGSILVRLS